MLRQTLNTQIGNYHGSIWVAKYDGKYYWLIENYDTDLNDIREYEEISKELYNMLINLK